MLNELMVRDGRDEPPPVPDGANAVLARELTTRAGHVMGRGVNRLLLYEQAGQAFLRAAGMGDEMPLALEGAYRWIGCLGAVAEALAGEVFRGDGAALLSLDQ
jgi:hypothetical protein